MKKLLLLVLTTPLFLVGMDIEQEDFDAVRQRIKTIQDGDLKIKRFITETRSRKRISFLVKSAGEIYGNRCDQGGYTGHWAVAYEACLYHKLNAGTSLLEALRIIQLDPFRSVDHPDVHAEVRPYLHKAVHTWDELQASLQADKEIFLSSYCQSE